MKLTKWILLGVLVFSGARLVAADAEAAYARALSIKPLLKTQADGTGKPLVFPTESPEATVVLVEVPPGTQTNWHKHPVPCFAYMLEGELTLELENGETRVLKAGEAFAEVVNVLHNGVNRGKVPAKLVMFVAGTAKTPYAVRATESAANK